MSRYDLTHEHLAALLSDQPAYRVGQLWRGLYQRFGEPEQLTDLPRELRERLAALETFAPALSCDSTTEADDGATRKWLSRLVGGASIETVLMHHQRHSTVCVSSQAGCAMACSFCATGHSGFTRQLTTGEIIEQVIVAARARADQGRRLDHVVFMGMGEPLANLAAVWPAVERIVGDIGLAARHVTISTVGVVPGIERLTREPLQINLAVSLHAANDDLRDRLVPLNRRYPLRLLLAACESCKGRRQHGCGHFATSSSRGT
jgi:23S rRNA (adenine2503-C2)-methyltransferase